MNLNELGALDLTNVDEWGGGWKPLPDGEYRVAITSATIEYGKTSQKPYLKLVYTVADGDFARRKLFDSFSLWIEKAIVAQKRYKSLRIALGLNGNILGDTDDLLNGEFVAVVRQRERFGREGEKENFIDAYKPVPGARPAAAPASPNRAPFASAAGGYEDIPW